LEGKGALLGRFGAFVDADVAVRSPLSIKRMILELVSGDAFELPRRICGAGVDDEFLCDAVLAINTQHGCRLQDSVTKRRNLHFSSITFDFRRATAPSNVPFGFKHSE